MNITATLIGQMLTFAVFVWFSMRFVWKPLTRIMEDRNKRIADGLAAAERGQHEQELAEQRAKETLHEAKQRASEIINQAQKRANEVVEEAKDDARSEGERILTAAQAEIEQERNRAREALRTQVASLALAGAEKVLQREVDADTHRDILDQLAQQI